MFKYKKNAIRGITIIFIILSIIELIKYILVDICLFGVIYLIANLFIIFLLVPLTYNYKRYYSVARISKLIMIILFGIFNSFILKNIVINNISYIDSSSIYSDKIFVIKNILKPVLYGSLTVFTIFEFKLDSVISKKKKVYKKK